MNYGFRVSTKGWPYQVALAVRRVLGSVQTASAVRVFVRADEDWDAQAWSFRQVIFQLAAEPLAASVRVVLTSPVTEIDDGAREDLAAWLESGLIQGVDTVDLGVGDVKPLVDLVSGDLISAWAIAGGDARGQIAGPEWGSNGLVLKGASRFPYSFTSVAIDQLRPPARGGNAGQITIAAHGAFPARKFGAWLAAELEKALPDIQAKLQQRPMRVHYSDRYFRSPDSPAVLAAFVHMIAEPGESRVPIEIRTSELEPSWSRNSNNRDFATEGERARAVVSAFKARPDLDASTTVRKKTLVDHARLLVAEYTDGSKLTIQLDQGVDFWACDPPPGLDGRIRPKYARQSTKITAWIE